MFKEELIESLKETEKALTEKIKDEYSKLSSVEKKDVIEQTNKFADILCDLFNVDEKDRETFYMTDEKLSDIKDKCKATCNKAKDTCNKVCDSTKNTYQEVKNNIPTVEQCKDKLSDVLDNVIKKVNDIIDAKKDKKDDNGSVNTDDRTYFDIVSDYDVEVNYPEDEITEDELDGIPCINCQDGECENCFFNPDYMDDKCFECDGSYTEATLNRLKKEAGLINDNTNVDDDYDTTDDDYDTTLEYSSRLYLAITEALEDVDGHNYKIYSKTESSPAAVEVVVEDIDPKFKNNTTLFTNLADEIRDDYGFKEVHISLTDDNKAHVFMVLE